MKSGRFQGICGVLMLGAQFLFSGCSVTSGGLVAAAYEGKTDEVARLLDGGRNVDERGSCGMYDTGGETGATPLFCAAHNGHLKTVELLLARGADVNARGNGLFNYGRTPLTAAVYSRNVAVVKLLLAKGANLDNALATLDRSGFREDAAFLRSIVAGLPSGQPVTITTSVRAVPEITADVDSLPAVAPRFRAKAYAVVIGIEHYRQQLPRADFAVHDAETVAKYLTGVLGYPGENVVTLTDDRASHVDVAKYIEKWLPNNVEAGGTVFVYYSGHGAPNPQTGDAYLLPYDGDPTFLEETGYSLKRLYNALGKLPAREVIVALDSCFSGAGGRSVIAPGTRSIGLNLKAQALLPSNLTVLAASSGEQTSSTYAEKGHGLFTYYLLKGIRDEGVVDADGTLRLSDLYAYLQPQVEQVARRKFNNEQTPQLIGLDGD